MVIRAPRLTPELRVLFQRFNAHVADVRPGIPRKRCRACRGFLWATGKTVHAVDGVYCTIVCAQWTQAEIDIFDDWLDLRDRHCGCSGSSGRKDGYESRKEARKHIPEHKPLRVYACPRKSGFFHLTKKDVDVKK